MMLHETVQGEVKRSGWPAGSIGGCAKNHHEHIPPTARAADVLSNLDPLIVIEGPQPVPSTTPACSCNVVTLIVHAEVPLLHAARWTQATSPQAPRGPVRLSCCAQRRAHSVCDSPTPLTHALHNGCHYLWAPTWMFGGSFPPCTSRTPHQSPSIQIHI